MDNPVDAHLYSYGLFSRYSKLLYTVVLYISIFSCFQFCICSTVFESAFHLQFQLECRMKMFLWFLSFREERKTQELPEKRDSSE